MIQKVGEVSYKPPVAQGNATNADTKGKRKSGKGLNPMTEMSKKPTHLNALKRAQDWTEEWQRERALCQA